MSPQGYEKKVFAYSIPTVVLSDQKHLLGKSLKRNQGTDLLVACCIFCLFDQGCYFSSDMLHYSGKNSFNEKEGRCATHKIPCKLKTNG